MKEQDLISLRRSKVMELLAQGYTNQREIAQMLSVSEPTVSRDIAHITRESKKNLGYLVQKRLPLEIERCYMALNLVLRKAFEITNLPNAKVSEKLQALSVILTTYDKIEDLIDNRHVADGIIKGFERKEEELQQREFEFQREKERQRMIEEGMNPELVDDIIHNHYVTNTQRYNNRRN
jgi:DNA-binding Lrp family transcriptional regulator